LRRTEAFTFPATDDVVSTVSRGQLRVTIKNVGYKGIDLSIDYIVPST